MTLTRLIRTMSSMHSTTMSLRRTGATTSGRDLAFSKQHFPKFLAATMAASGLTGYFAMEYIQQKQFETRDALYDKVRDDHHHRQQTQHNEVMLSAMLENAKQSSWQENIDNAMEAHEHFMLGSSQPPGTLEDPSFLKQIRAKAQLQQQEKTSRSNDTTKGEQHQWAAAE